jgi:hypothetical protein
VVSVIALVAGLTSTAASASGPKFGTVDGTVTSQGGQPLNGICVDLFNPTYTTLEVQFAASGTSGPAGFFTQANVPVGQYIALFTNCGANTGGSPDPNYTAIFDGGTYNPTNARVITVQKNLTKSLGTNPIPLGGTVTGTATNGTAGGPAWPIAVGVEIPGAKNFNLTSPFNFLIVCAGTDGTYSVSGVPTGGVKMFFAPNNWACPDGSGNFNFGFWVQTKVKGVNTAPDGTVIGVNASVPEAGHSAAARSGLHGNHGAAGPVHA